MTRICSRDTISGSKVTATTSHVQSILCRLLCSRVFLCATCVPRNDFGDSMNSLEHGLYTPKNNLPQPSAFPISFPPGFRLRMESRSQASWTICLPFLTFEKVKLSELRLAKRKTQRPGPLDRSVCNATWVGPLWMDWKGSSILAWASTPTTESTNSSSRRALPQRGCPMAASNADRTRDLKSSIDPSLARMRSASSLFFSMDICDFSRFSSSSVSSSAELRFVRAAIEGCRTNQTSSHRRSQPRSYRSGISSASIPLWLWVCHRSMCSSNLCRIRGEQSPQVACVDSDAALIRQTPMRPPWLGLPYLALRAR